MIIDTPGMRELGMLDDVSVGLGETFSDVVSYLDGVSLAIAGIKPSRAAQFGRRLR